MPSKRLLTCGLLNKYPLKSETFQRLANPSRKHFTEYQKMQACALYWTPELPKTWMAYQFERLGFDHETAMRKLRSIVYKKETRAKYQNIGRENLMFLGRDEVQRYYDRRNPNIKMTHPTWALLVFHDLVKQGMSKAEIARQFGIEVSTLKNAMRLRSMFEERKCNLEGHRVLFKDQPNWLTST